MVVFNFSWCHQVMFCDELSATLKQSQITHKKSLPIYFSVSYPLSYSLACKKGGCELQNSGGQ